MLYKNRFQFSFFDIYWLKLNILGDFQLEVNNVKNRPYPAEEGLDLSTVKQNSSCRDKDKTKVNDLVLVFTDVLQQLTRNTLCELN